MNAEQAFALHPLAAQDITEIWEYIADDNPLAARRVREEIYSAIRVTSRPLRFTMVREYLIAYAPDEKPLWIVAVMHGWRSPRIMAAIALLFDFATHANYPAAVNASSTVSRRCSVNIRRRCGTPM